MQYSYRIEQAIRAAAVLHKDQIRKGQAPYPYITHPYAVMVVASDYTDDEDVLVACLLHDTVEDTDYTLEEVNQDFGGNVSDLVESVTEVSEDKDGNRYSWKMVKKNYVKRLKKAPVNALIIVAADKLHNMRTVIEEYYEDHARFLADFNGTFEDRLQVYQDISNILNSRLKNDIVHEFNHVFEEYKNFIQHAQEEEY